VPERFAATHPRQRADYHADPESRPTRVGLELLACRRDGSEFPAEISLSAVGDGAGGHLVMTGVRDVSERLAQHAIQQHEALAEQARRLESLGLLAGGIAHDFNNLLGVILNYSALLAHRVDGPGDQEDLAEIRSAAERAAALTQQLLTFASRDLARPRPIDLNEVVRAVAPTLERALGPTTDLALDLAGEPLVALADRGQLEQVLVNLVVNAVEAMPEGGLVTVATGSGAGAEVVLTVHDQGTGMAPDVAARAFEPFFSTKPAGAGAGLGLATVYGIVRRAGGEVAIGSEVGTGSTVTVRLPAASPVVDEPPAPSEPILGGVERILLVDDEAALRAGMARLLGESGYDVITAADGLEALELYEGDERGIDLVLTDVTMPRMRGDALAAALDARDAQVPVIFMSGYASGGAPTIGRLLPKPVPEDVLLKTIREVLDA
jgi:signal transduction histidine kinase